MIDIEKVDLKRRFFCFGAAAALVVPAKKSFFIIEPPKLVRAVVDPGRLSFDLPLPEILSLLRKIEQGMLEVSAIPRWVVTNKDVYDDIVYGEKHGRQYASVRDHRLGGEATPQRPARPA
jgi:hypothetical protein